MSASMRLTVGGIRAAAAASPALGGRLAVPLFFSTGQRMRVRADDEATHDAARRDVIHVRGHALRTYQWGTGTRAALLVHGWQGRASQFATLVRDLVGEGFRVHAFDAPAHGDSAGTDADARDWIAAAQQLARTDGPFELAVGHSFGAFAALAAVRDGVEVERVVSIAGAGDVGAFHTQFARMIGLPAPALTAFRAGFYRRLGMDRTAADALFDTLAHPLPAETELLVIHDRGDRTLDVRNSVALHEAHGERSRLLLTQGLGHRRILAADAPLDAVLAFCAGGVRAVDTARVREEQRVE